MTRRLVSPHATAVFALAAGLAVLSAQGIPPPPPPPPPPPSPVRDGPIAPQTGTARLAGVIVTNDAAAEPVRRAILLLNGGGLLMAHQTATDDEGRFAFGSLPAGRYTLTAWRSGFVRDNYGNKRPGAGSGVPIDLAKDDRVDITMKLTRHAVITGAVVSAGAPTFASYVQAMQYRRVGGERKLFPATSGGVSPMVGMPGVIDDRGVYRIYGLPPGEYVIMTSPSSTELRAMTPSLVEWATQQFQRSASVPPPALRPMGYAPVYYPGTTDPAAAVVITVAAGEERGGIDLPLQLVPVAKIEGITTGPGGPVPNAQVTLQIMGMPGYAGPSLSARSQPDGRFTLSGVPPGRHKIVARATAPGGPSGRGGAPSAPALWALMNIEIAGQDITGMSIALQPGTTLTGRVVLEGQSTPPATGSLRLVLSPLQQDFSSASAAGVAAEDGTFAIAGIAPGSYSLMQISGAPTTWALKSAMLEGRDLLDGPVEIRPGQPVTGVTVTFTDRPAGLSGSLMDADGKATTDYFIIAFPTDRKFWTWNSRRVVTARPASTGAFSLSGLPPGEYFLCAVTDIDANEMYDPAVLEPLTRAATKFTLADGEQKVQNLKLAGR